MTTVASKLTQQLFYFIAVGASAAGVHILTVMHLVTYSHTSPLGANMIAFICAFNISYLGHKHLSFSQLPSQKKLRLFHFFLIALSGGVLNETLYYFLLHYTHMHYLIALILVLGLVATYSFFLSRFWACR